MLARLFAFAIWAVVAASLMFWGLRLLTSAPVAPAYTVSALDGTGLRGDLARVFGTTPVAATVAAAPPAQASRFKLVGVAAPRDANVQGGLALISVDGKPARAINVGRTIDDGWVLQSVTRRGARLATNLGASTLDLEMPALALASRGSLPPVANTIVNALPNAPSNPSLNGAVPPIVPLPFPGLPPPLVPATPLPSAGPAPGVGISALPPSADGRVLQNPVTLVPGAPPAPGAAAGPPAIYVPPEELPRPPTRIRQPRINGAADSAAASAPQ